MLSLLTRLLTHQLPPVLSLTSLILGFLALLAPVPILHTSVSLLSVTPSTASYSPTSKRDFVRIEELSRFHMRELKAMDIEMRDASSANIDGPTVVMGLLGSCSRSFNESPMNCSNSTFSPVYDLSALPPAAPQLALTSPTTTTPEFLLTSLLLLTLFALHNSLYSLLPPTARIINPLTRLARAAAWVGVIGWLVGMVTVIVLRAWYGNAQEDFNRHIAEAGMTAPQLTATIGNGFTMLWISYAFAVPSLLCALMKLNQQPPKE